MELLVAEIREAASQPVFEQAFCLRREFKETSVPAERGTSHQACGGRVRGWVGPLDPRSPILPHLSSRDPQSAWRVNVKIDMI